MPAKEGERQQVVNHGDRRAIRKALHRASFVRTILCVPSRTDRSSLLGSFLEDGHALVGTDASQVALREAAAALGDEPPRTMLGFVQCDAEALAFRESSFDAVVSVGAVIHLTPERRVKALSEFARVSRRWVMVDYRHRHALKDVLERWAHALRLGPAPAARMSREDIESEAYDARLNVVAVFTVLPILSDRWIVLFERRH